jgi:large subunit ribosomal protein L25
VPITVARDDVWNMIKAASHLAELDLGDATETVLIRDVQWDNLGKEILHLDFARVSAEELIETEVNIEVRGHAAGVAEGGILEQLVHSIRVKCPAGAIPDSIKIDVSEVKLGEGIHVRDLALPANLTLDADPDLLILHVVMRGAQAETPEPAAAEAATQPEVIKPERKEKEKE